MAMTQSSILVIFLIAISAFLLIFKNNFLFFFIALEILFLAINLEWIFMALELDETTGAAVALILIALAAVDAAIGLSLLLKYFSASYTGKIEISEMTHIKG